MDSLDRLILGTTISSSESWMLLPSFSTNISWNSFFVLLEMLKMRYLKVFTFCSIRKKKNVDTRVYVKTEVHNRLIRAFIITSTPDVKIMPSLICRVRPTTYPNPTDHTKLRIHSDRKKKVSTPYMIPSIFRLLRAITAALLAPDTNPSPVKAMVMML